MRRTSLRFLLSLFFSLLLIGCNKEAGPEDVFSDYVNLWNDQKFEEMYDMLTESIRKEIPENEFTGRYEKIYSDLEVTDLQVEFKQPEEREPKGGKIAFPFSVSMNTVAGPIAFDQEAELIQEERDGETNWYVNWNPGFIFAGMEFSDKIGYHTIKAERGEIIDRYGRGLAVNGEVFEAGLVPEQMEGREQEIKAQLSQLLHISIESIDEALNASWVQPHYYVPIKKFSIDDVDLKNTLLNIPGVQVRTAKARVYPFKEAAAHLIGYVGKVTAEDLEKNEGYSSNDSIGKRGLEQLFEKRLKGENGVKITIQKPDGTEVVLAEKPVKNGETIQLTIDGDLQQMIFETFNGKAGTSVALHPKTGETLALVSSPSFDPNTFILGISGQRYKELEEDPLKPLINRFVLPHTPGSVMKPFTAGVGLETGTIIPEETLDIRGKNWKKDDSWGGYVITRVTDPGKPVDLKDAFVFSDNIYFAQQAIRMGANDFISGLEKFGFGEEIPFTYPLQPSKISNSGSVDNDILLADSAYGQGEVQMNIVHMASGYTAFINEGNMIKPILLKDEESGQVWKEGILSSEHAQMIAQYLRQVVADPKGTGHLANSEELPLAGKTGTAETLKSAQGKQGMENGWFVAYREDTKDLLVAMMMEEIQKDGSKMVVEKVKNIFLEWDNKKAE